MPKIPYDTKDAVPEGLREYAEEKDGTWTVDVAPTIKVTEFRDNNITLAKERDTLKNAVGKYEKIIGDDVETFSTELTELRDVSQQVKDGAFKGTDAIKKEVDSRIASIKEGYDGQIKELSDNLNKALEVGSGYKGKYESSVLDSQITNAVLDPKSGMNPTALPDIMTRARELFHVQEDGNVVPMKGETILYGADGATPMTPQEWLPKLGESAPHLRLPSEGGGSTGGKGAKYGGMEKEKFQKLSPRERLTIAHEQDL